VRPVGVGVGVRLDDRPVGAAWGLDRPVGVGLDRPVGVGLDRPVGVDLDRPRRRGPGPAP
jgi:hypothetical protein